MPRAVQILCILFVSTIFRLSACADEPERIITQVCAKDVCLSAEIADTDERRQAGLMFRDDLPENKAMLFIFPDDGLHHFWMKNMNFPIDIIWLDSEKKIVFIASGLPACTQDSCPVYTSSQPARYVLEVVSGFARRHQIALGDSIEFTQ